VLTNNPKKIESLSELGIQVVKRIPTHVVPNPFSAPYLEVKRRRMQHELPSSPGAAPAPAAHPSGGKTPRTGS